MQLLAVAARPDAQHNAPWVRTLESFGVPLLLYRRDGGRGDMSPAAAGVFAGHAAAPSLLAAADRIAAEAITRAAPRFRLAPVLHVRELDVAVAGVSLAVHLLGAGAEPWVAAVVASPRLGREPAALDALSRRENDVARLIGIGLSTKEIARSLGISPHTARHHTERIFTRLGVTTRAGVAALVGERRARWNDGEALLR